MIPGNHDVQWWRRPFIPFGKDAAYQKYRSYFGADLTPTLTIPGGVNGGFHRLDELLIGRTEIGPRRVCRVVAGARRGRPRPEVSRRRECLSDDEPGR